MKKLFSIKKKLIFKKKRNTMYSKNLFHNLALQSFTIRKTFQKNSYTTQIDSFLKWSPSLREAVPSNTLYSKRFDRETFKEKFINLLMVDGKKTKATLLFNKAAFLLRKKIYSTKKTSGIWSSVIVNHDTTSGTGFQDTLSHSEEMNKPIKETFANYLNFVDEKQYSLETLLENCVQNIKPSIEVRKVRIAGTTYQVPAILSKKRGEILAIRWILEAAKKQKHKSEKNFSECLALELFDAYNKQGHARQKRDELHRIAEINRAYIRYRWW